MEKLKEADAFDLEGKTDNEIRALEVVEELRAKRADKQSLLLLDAFNKDRASLPQPLPNPLPLAPLPALAPPDPCTQEMINEKLSKAEDFAMEDDFYFEDAKRLCKKIQYQEKLLRMKRRWLMGLPLISKSKSSLKASRKPKFLTNVYLLESFMRDDDVSSEAVRTSVGKAYKAFTGNQEKNHMVWYNNLQHFNKNVLHNDKIHPSSILQTVYCALDDLNGKGLCRLANISTGNKIEFEKTRPRMKKVIKEHLPNLLRRPSDVDWMEQLEKLFMDSSNFQNNLVPHVSESLLSAVNKILERLEDLCFFTLSAMYRMLKGAQVVPQLHYIRSGWTRKRLISMIRKMCNRMVSELCEKDELPRPLAKSMAIAVLSLKEIRGLTDFPLPEFFQFSPEIEVLQNDILNAIQSLPKVKPRELKDLKRIVDPKAEIPMKSFRIYVRRYLIQCLFECSEVDMPKLLFRTMAFINRPSRRKLGVCFSKEKMDEELECVLDLSSQLRQIIWELHSENNIDKDFADAFIDDLESDNDLNHDFLDMDDDRNCTNYFDGFHHEDSHFGLSNCQFDSNDESVGDSRPAISRPQNYSANGSSSPQHSVACENVNDNFAEEPESQQIARSTLSNQHVSVSSYHMGSARQSSESSLYDTESKNRNKYVAVQDICDDTSLVAHQLIGCLLEEFLVIEDIVFNSSTRSYLRGGVSIPDVLQDGEAETSSKEDTGQILIRTVEKLIPSLTKSGMERMKELIGLP